MMKRLILLLIGLTASLVLQAQTITAGTKWFDGRLMFEASEVSGGFQLQSTANGQTTTYQLAAMPFQTGWYAFKENAAETYDESEIASITEAEGRVMLVVYKDGKVVMLFERTEKSFEDIIAERWLPTVRGKYTCKTPEGNVLDVVIDDYVFSVDGVSAPYKVITSNGYPLDVLDVEEGPVKGAWHFIRTSEGFNIYKSRLTGAGTYEQMYEEIDERPYVLTWADPEKSRWAYLSNVFIIPIHFSKSTLRQIRNNILAEHGYVFRNRDLQKYFKAQPWYKPVKDNNSIELNFIEQMNTARIQGEESKPEEARVRVTEEIPGVKGARRE